MIVAMLGIMKAGGAYMPVSPEFPLKRIEFMLEIADISVILTFGYDMAMDNKYFNENKIEIISLDTIDYFANIHEVQNKNVHEDLCYIIFTSGSTGQPKGIAIKHQNIVNYCHGDECNICSKCIKSDNNIVSVTNIIFDIFSTESLLPLVNGLTIYLANDAEIMSQNKLSKLIIENNIDVLQTTPTKMRSYLIDRNNLEYLSILKTIILGGEVCPNINKLAHTCIGMIASRVSMV